MTGFEPRISNVASTTLLTTPRHDFVFCYSTFGTRVSTYFLYKALIELTKFSVQDKTFGVPKKALRRWLKILFDLFDLAVLR